MKFVVFCQKEQRLRLEIRSLLQFQFIKHLTVLLADADVTLNPSNPEIQHPLEVHLRVLVQEYLLYRGVCRTLERAVEYVMDINS